MSRDVRPCLYIMELQNTEEEGDHHGQRLGSLPTCVHLIFFKIHLIIMCVDIWPKCMSVWVHWVHWN